MPMYVYSCRECGRVHEVLRRIAERDEPHRCPTCGSETARQVTGANLALSGSFHKTSYQTKPYKDAAETRRGAGIRLVGSTTGNATIHDNVISGVPVGISVPAKSSVSIKNNTIEKVQTPVEFTK